MADSKSEDKQHKGRRLSDQTRLDSWKAIANYLNRSVRTVRRWEESEGLPVHRHRHKKGFSVYAYCSELDSWRLGHRPNDPELPAKHNRTRLYSGLAPSVRVIGVLAVAGGILTWFISSSGLLSAPGGSQGTGHALATAGKDRLAVVDVSEVGGSPIAIRRVSDFVILPVLTAWQEGRPRDALREIEKLRVTLPEFPAAIRDYLVSYLVDISLSMGRIDDATGLLASMDDGHRQYELRTSILFALGDKENMRAHLQNGRDFQGATTPLFMAMAGLVDEAIELESTLATDVPRSGRSKVIRAIASLEAGNTQDAKTLLQEAVAALDISDQAYYFVALDSLSGVLNSDGQLVDAIDVLEETMPLRDQATANRSGLFWTMCQRQLAKLYRDAGRGSDAAQLESALRSQLILSDQKFPLARSLDDA